MSEAGDLWKENLKDSGYQHYCRDQRDFDGVKKLSAMWRMILNTVRLRPGSRVFEVGTGGGNHMVKLQLNGFKCRGIDVSPDVISRSLTYIDQVAKFDTRVKEISILEGDFLDDTDTNLGSEYDLVFDSGVIEHFLEDPVRLDFLQRKFDLAKSGGWVVTIVPSGIHPGRQALRDNGWGGYNVPEIDYSPELLVEEHQTVGFTDIQVVPYNLFGYKNAIPTSTPIRYLYKLANISWRVAPGIFPAGVARKHAFAYVAIAKK